MSRFLGSRVTIVALLVSILLLVVGVSVAKGTGPLSGSSSNSAADAPAELPSILAAPIQVELKDCKGNAKFDVYGSGWKNKDVILVSLTIPTGRLFIGAGFPGPSNAFISSVVAPVTECGILTVKATGEGCVNVNTPVNIIKPN